MLRRPRFLLNSVDTTGGSTPKADSYQNGSQRAADPTTSLTEKERATLTKMLANPLDFPQEFPGWLDDFVRLRLTASQIAGLGGYTGTTGELLVLTKDYTAETGVYTIEAKGGTWMYLNGATFDTTTYADLYAYLGTATLPDTRGRSIWLTGTNAATDLFDNDGVAEASREPKHQHSFSGSLTGATAASNGAHTHSYVYPVETANSAGTFNATGVNSGGLASTSSDGAHTHTVSGTVSGTAGSGMSGSDAVAHIVLGSAFVHV